MPKKYHVKVNPAPPRLAPVAPFAGLEIEGCLGCLECVKRDSCVYDVYGQRAYAAGQMVDTWDSLCKGCLRCVQECKKGILSRVVNPAYARMGDGYWTPDLISSIWKQAESGKIPVSGAGYRGAFTGPGFDRMWTDMSEIVRPTRDGIHGREYISTLIELGPKLTRLEFGPDGSLTSQPPKTKPLSVPVILDQPTKGIMTEGVRLGAARAANLLETLALADPSELDGLVGEFKDNLIVRFDPDRDDAAILADLSVIELPLTDRTEDRIAELAQTHPDLVVSVGCPWTKPLPGERSAWPKPGPG